MFKARPPPVSTTPPPSTAPPPPPPPPLDPPPPPLPCPSPGPTPSSSGGVYIASNVPSSTRVWNCQVTNDEIIGKNGNIEPLREFLPSMGFLLESDCMYWMSDSIPHESLPMQFTRMRQFFRIMTSEVEFWFKDHYTANPLGVLPDPSVTEIVAGNVSSEEELQILNDWKPEGYKQMEVVGKERREGKLGQLRHCVVDGVNRFRHRPDREHNFIVGRPDAEQESDSDFSRLLRDCVVDGVNRFRHRPDADQQSDSEDSEDSDWSSDWS